MPRFTRISKGIGVAVVGAGVAVFGLAGAASAHVRVTGQDATQGGYGVLTFRVPTESATASTTEIRVTFPATTPITSVSTQPIPGWTAKVISKKLATPVATDSGTITTYVAAVDWKADSAKDAITPGEFEMFNVSAGPLPTVSSVAFPTRQVYSDGTIVNWDQIAQGDAEPEHPAPALTLAPAGTTPGAIVSTSDSNDGSSSWPGIVGLIAGVLGLICGAAALARSGRTGAKTV